MLYDLGAGCSLINYSMYETLGIDLDNGYQPIVKSLTRENMGALGQVTYTFTINSTQSFIVCRHVTRHIIYIYIYIPLSILNLSHVDYFYIGRDAVVAFADKPTVDVYNVELVKEQPRNWVPQHHETLPEIPSNSFYLFICRCPRSQKGPSPGQRSVSGHSPEI